MSATRTRIAAGILGLTLVTALGTAGVATAATAPTPACAQATTTLATTNASLAGAKTDNNAEQAAYTTAKNNRARDAAAGDVSATQRDGQSVESLAALSATTEQQVFVFMAQQVRDRAAKKTACGA